MHKVGVIHGRFQGLHLGHIEYLLAGKERCEFLYVGITNPDSRLTANSPQDPKRSKSVANPFTYYERLTMLRDSLLEFGVGRSEFEVIPFPINYPNLIRYYAPPDAVYFVTIYDDWGREKALELRKLGLNVEIMWEKTMEDRLTTGTEVRTLISSGDPWKHLVPKSVFAYINREDIISRFKKED